MEDEVNPHQAKLLMALLKSGERGLLLSQLLKRTDVKDPRNELRRLRRRNPLWHEAIVPPGEKGRRYRIRYQ